MKPILYALNTSEAASENKLDAAAKIPGPYVEIDPVFEKGFDNLIKKAYETLGLITYFTTGEDETRAWTITKGWTAPLAGTAIHGDFKDKFIRAEVVHCDDLLKSGGYAAAREKGLVRTEGKEYIVKDGDVIEFKI
jgi:ribosome-binding ATPase YchF (GTP1/OBG family)